MSADKPRFPEREHYGCVNCGSTNHTTGDANWCPLELFPGSHYVRCVDPACPVAYAFAAEQRQPHYHFTGSAEHPAWDVP